MGILGAIVAGTNATAKNVELLRQGSISETDAVLDIGEEALKNGLATALTFATVAVIGGELIASVAATLVIGASLKFLWDRSSDYVEKTVKSPVQATAASKKKAV
jgi:hypothetical protein